MENRDVQLTVLLCLSLVSCVEHVHARVLRRKREKTLFFKNEGLDLSNSARQIAHAAYQDGASQRLRPISLKMVLFGFAWFFFVSVTYRGFFVICPSLELAKSLQVAVATSINFICLLT